MRQLRTRPGVMAMACALVPVWGPAPVAFAQDMPTVVACQDVDGLIQAITAANQAGGGSITLAANCAYTLTKAHTNDTDGVSGLPAVTSKVVIKGQKSTIVRDKAKQTPSFRIFTVLPTGDLTLDGVTVENGYTGQRSGLRGNGGGIYNRAGTLTLHNSVITGNWANNNTCLSSPTGGGGGIYTQGGKVVLTKTTVTKNWAWGNCPTHGGGIYNQGGTLEVNTQTFVTENTARIVGGGISTTGNTTVKDSVVSGNKADIPLGSPHIAAGGGGIYVTRGTVNIEGSDIHHNSAYVKSDLANGRTGGGGIHVNNGGRANLKDTKVHENTGNDGGGINVTGGTATLDNSGVYKNWASHGGGGVFNTSTLNLNSGHIDGNETPGRGGGILNTARVNVRSGFILRGNKPNNCQDVPKNTPEGCGGRFG